MFAKAISKQKERQAGRREGGREGGGQTGHSLLQVQVTFTKCLRSGKDGTKRLLSPTMCHPGPISFQKAPNTHSSTTIEQGTLSTSSPPVSAGTQIQIKSKRKLAKGGEKEGGEARENAKATWKPHKGKGGRMRQEASEGGLINRTERCGEQQRGFH